MEDKGLRFNEGKTQLGLIPPHSLEQLGRVLTFGAEKYTRNNYRKGMKWSKVLDSLERHINAFKSGEDYDEESGELHMAHVMCNASFLLEYYSIYPQGDDRVHSYLETPSVGLDIDDVLSDLVGKWQRNFNCPTPIWWDDHNFRAERFEDLGKDFWMSLPRKVNPANLAFEPVGYVTSRSIPLEWTREWLFNNGFPDVPLISVGHGVSKVEAVREIGCDVFVDDRFDNFLELNKAGLCCYLMDMPHNERHKVGYKRIMDLEDFQR